MNRSFFHRGQIWVKENAKLVEINCIKWKKGTKCTPGIFCGDKSKQFQDFAQFLVRIVIYRFFGQYVMFVFPPFCMFAAMWLVRSVAVKLRVHCTTNATFVIFHLLILCPFNMEWKLWDQIFGELAAKELCKRRSGFWKRFRGKPLPAAVENINCQIEGDNISDRCLFQRRTPNESTEWFDSKVCKTQVCISLTNPLKCEIILSSDIIQLFSWVW